LSFKKECGINKGEIKFEELIRNIKSEGNILVLTDAEERKNRYQMGLETPVVYSVNDECSFLDVYLLET